MIPSELGGPERRIKAAGLLIHRPTSTAASIGDQDINAAPLGDDPRHHRVDRLVVGHIDLDPQCGATHRLDLSDGAVAGHVLGLGLEFLIRVQVEVGDCDFGPQPGEPFRVGASETSCRARDDRHLAVQLAHSSPPDSATLAAIRAILGSMNEETRLTRFLDWLRDLPMLAGLWLLDRAAGPYPETKADRIRERRKERLRRAFPDTDVDGTGSRSG
jgi:hypothetical protein